jgi:glycosyltransferase involved in cell wall biosynthesis
MARKLRSALDSIPGLDASYILIEPEDYLKYPAPRWARATNPWEAEYIAQQKVKALAPSGFDVVLLNAWELVVAFEDLIRKAKSAAILDAIPSTFDAQLRQRGIGGWKRRLAHTVHDRAFRRAARRIDLFLPMGSDCRDALERDYGVAPEKCSAVTFTPQDLEATRTERRHYAPPLRLVFVGNDFFRKGGEFLLRLYTERLSTISKLTIVSSDPALDGRALSPGVERLSFLNFEQLSVVYRASHVFVFPTQQDFMPQVLAEALAFGLPCIANDVGAVRDLVRTGETGFLMSQGSSMEDWASRIERLAADPTELERLSGAARAFAEQNLSPSRFQSLLENAMQRLR